MSNVTHVLILTLGDGEAMAALTERREGAAWRGYFGDLSQKPAAEFWGHDGKWPECWVWAGAFNHLNRPALLQELQEVPWQNRKSVQVLIRGQDDDCWGMWMFVEGSELRPEEGGGLIEVNLPGATRLPLQASSMVQDQEIYFEVGARRQTRPRSRATPVSTPLGEHGISSSTPTSSRQPLLGSSRWRAMQQSRALKRPLLQPCASGLELGTTSSGGSSGTARAGGET
jgi:hypothetical protein